ncbi:MAG: Release factor glutamine methyltransferase [Alphaproteobacteria bacterium ADurb.Bin438]|nr:MAG: Release factor glutamine methyltransferase [Alphaproteobacteria bacterium ADurb.Bin438]
MINSKNYQNLARALKEEGIDNPELEARWLVKYSKPSLLDENLKRRLNFEPLAKILGSKGFYKHEFITTKDTLDPRADSEVLLYDAFEIFKDKNKDLKVIDVCSGTGCLGLSFCFEYPNSNLTLLDISDKAILVSKQNADNLGLQNRCDFINMDMNYFHDFGFDLCLFNPPYLRSEEMAFLDKETKYDPSLALDGGASGLDFYQNFNEKIIKNGGYLILEIGQNQEMDVEKIMKNKGLSLVKISKDIANINRSMVFVKNL